ncbi:MAG: NAD(P)H-dependent oxidoreductase [Bacteroidales bacterium]|nr:NAD(P)H-dependent oxidoreductase [Bacteroidales bacterium]
MKVIKNLLISLAALLISGAAMAQNSKAIVIFFSHAGENYKVGNIEVGNTKIVADYISEITGADQFEVVAVKSYDMPYNKLIEVAKKEQQTGEKPAFKGELKGLEKYDTVFVGTPIWWGTFPQVMFTFFDKYDLSGKKIYPFSTHEGSGLGSIVKDLQRIYPKGDIQKGFSIYGHDVRSGKEKVAKWLSGIGFPSK